MAVGLSGRPLVARSAHWPVSYSPLLSLSPSFLFLISISERNQWPLALYSSPGALSLRVSQREKLAQLGWLSTSPGDKNPFGKNRILRQRVEKEKRIMPRCEPHAGTHCDGKNAEKEEIPARKNTLSWSKTR
ncbi:unnamed protein product [Oikopleura dioica]|uniref:Uncharacterized protein n=1 Tax=Oikopleura dioica TaxID=34765 RepID=E4XGS0_OIKDI|nr:unnamed protein product [Oikopleura dioica]